MNFSNPCDTVEFAKMNGIKSASVRSRLWKTGSYYGVQPQKLANGRLLWPRLSVSMNLPGTPGEPIGGCANGQRQHNAGKPVKC
jgi:hypothetical protein